MFVVIPAINQTLERHLLKANKRHPFISFYSMINHRVCNITVLCTLDTSLRRRQVSRKPD